ncbi:MAG: hypothetical protein ABSB32_18050 [Thermodesulfobacteriota bacterium]|jgi:hypothetical protein
MNQYPDICLRGLRKEDDVITPQNVVNTTAFIPDFRIQRTDGSYETSINWKDDEFAISFTMQRRNQSQYGLAALERVILDEERSWTSIPKTIEYERKPDPENKYHGNIVFIGNKKYIRMIAAALALKSKFIPRED